MAATDTYVCAEIEETPVYEGADTSATPYRLSTNRFWFPATAFQVNPNTEWMSRTNEARNINAAPPDLVNGFRPAGSMSLFAYPNSLAFLLMLAGWDVAITNGAGTNEVQTLTATGTVSGGTYTIETPAAMGGEITDPIPYNASNARIQKELERLPGVRKGEVLVGGGPFPGTPVTFTFRGRWAATNVDLLVCEDASITGGGTAAIAQTTPGAAGAVVDPDGAGIPTGARRLVFTKRNKSTARSAQFTVARGQNSFFERGNGFGVQSLSLSQAGDVSADLVGLWYRRIVDPSLTPAFDTLAAHPLRMGDLTLEWANAESLIDDFSISIANPLEVGDHRGIRSFFPKVLEHTGEPTMLTGSMSTRYIVDADMDLLMSGDPFPATAKWVSESLVGSTGGAYSMWVEMPACMHKSGGPAELGNNRRWPASFEWAAHYDESAGYDAKVTLVCGVTAFETFS